MYLELSEYGIKVIAVVVLFAIYAKTIVAIYTKKGK